MKGMTDTKEGRGTREKTRVWCMYVQEYGKHSGELVKLGTTGK